MRADLHYDKGCFNVRVPRGREGYWKIILDLDKQGTFTIKDIDRESNVDAGEIRAYVRLLVKAGIVRIECHERRRGSDVPVYRLVKKPKAAPRLRADGSVIVATMQEQVWTAIRSLKTFGLDELVFAATTDDVKISKAFAQRYVTRLTTAGYLAVVQSQAGRHRKQVWRLKPNANSGPKPPVPFRATVMWDPNLSAEVGEWPIAEEVAI